MTCNAYPALTIARPTDAPAQTDANGQSPEFQEASPPAPGSAMAAPVPTSSASLDSAAQRSHSLCATANSLSSAFEQYAALLNSPVPPVPVRSEDDDMDMDEEADIDDEDEDDEEPAAPPTAAPTPAPTPAVTTEAQSLSPAVQRVADYIRAHPGCTVVEMRKALQVGNTTLSTYIGHIRRAGLPVESEGRPAVYRMGGGANG